MFTNIISILKKESLDIISIEDFTELDNVNIELNNLIKVYTTLSENKLSTSTLKIANSLISFESIGLDYNKLKSEVETKKNQIALEGILGTVKDKIVALWDWIIDKIKSLISFIGRLFSSKSVEERKNTIKDIEQLEKEQQEFIKNLREAEQKAIAASKLVKNVDDLFDKLVGDKEFKEFTKKSGLERVVKQLNDNKPIKENLPELEKKLKVVVDNTEKEIDNKTRAVTVKVPSLNLGKKRLNLLLDLFSVYQDQIHSLKTADRDNNFDLRIHEYLSKELPKHEFPNILKVQVTDSNIHLFFEPMNTKTKNLQADFQKVPIITDTIKLAEYYETGKHISDKTAEFLAVLEELKSKEISSANNTSEVNLTRSCAHAAQLLIKGVTLINTTYGKDLIEINRTLEYIKTIDPVKILRQEANKVIEENKK